MQLLLVQSVKGLRPKTAATMYCVGLGGLAISEWDPQSHSTHLRGSNTRPSSHHGVACTRRLAQT